MKGWVNRNLYLPTSEQISILPVPDDVQVASGMAEFNHDLLSADKVSFLPGTHARNMEGHSSSPYYS
jgi:hypothetical protein